MTSKICLQFSNVGDEDVQLMIALTGDIHPVIYPRWGADASDAQRMDLMAFDTRCPSKVRAFISEEYKGSG